MPFGIFRELVGLVNMFNKSRKLIFFLYAFKWCMSLSLNDTLNSNLRSDALLQNDNIRDFMVFVPGVYKTHQSVPNPIDVNQ